MSEVTVRPARGATGGGPGGWLSRTCGLGGVFGKTLRDSRFGIAGAAGFVAFTLLAGGAAMSTTYGTALARAEMAAYTTQIPAAMSGVYGLPVAVDTLGGFLSWHYSGLFAMIVGLWSILALSSTLAAELRRGSLELVLASPLTRRRIALEKVGGHVAALVVAMLVVAGAAWLTGTLWAKFPSDSVALGPALAFALKLGLMALIPGSVAFAVAPFLGQRGAAGLAGAAMLGAYVVNGWAGAVEWFRPFAGLTWFSWTASHLPLSGAWDWPSQLAMAVMVVVLLAIGVEGFVRRDAVATGGIPLPGMPAPLLGIRGATRRALGEQLPTALAWGVGLGAYGFVVAAASRSFTEGIREVPELLGMVKSIFPGIDITTPGGFLQMAFVEFGFLAAGLAAATFVAGWASDEFSGRLELLLATPLSRARSAVAGGLAAVASGGIAVALLAVAIAAGAAIAGGDILTPIVGTAVLAAYCAALAGLGVGVGGILGARVAAPAVAMLALATFVVDMLAPALNLPDLVHQAALSAHLGQPMVGQWDWVGIVACAALAAGGIAAGAMGMRRRDVNA